MKAILTSTLVLASALLCAQPISTALGQVPGGGGSTGGGQAPGATPSTFPNSNSNSRNANGPIGTTNTPEASPSKMNDKKFVKDAAVGGMTEVELGKLAAQKASREDVKQFGQKMVDDHGKANDQLKEIATKENITIPDSLDSKHQARVDKLSKLSGAEFDKAYAKDQLKDHEQDVREFQAEAEKGTDPNIKAFASTTLPTLQEHLSMAKSMNKPASK